MNDTTTYDKEGVPGVWAPIIFGALAGGMAWGIRGQYGHETGAMIAGLLVSLTLTFLLCPKAPSFGVMRAVAMCTVAMGFGGSMTYGQTLGLSHNAETVGHAGALAWGLLGCFIKGGIWIGFAGVFLGMGLSGQRYKSIEMVGLFVAMIGAYFIGTRLLNYPIDAETPKLPLFYFSEHFWWDAHEEFDPRRESWGGLLFALVVAITFVAAIRKDKLARNMAIWGIVGGAIGFPLGQGLQAYEAWHPEMFEQGIWEKLGPKMNWWNWMETVFGATMGAFLGLGLWLNRRKIAFTPQSQERRMPQYAELTLLAIHVTLIYFVDFRAVRSVDVLYDLGLVMGIIPMACIVSGWLSPYLMALPITLMPIAGKTYRKLVLENDQFADADTNLLLIKTVPYIVVPLAIAVGAAIYFAERATTGPSRRQLTAPMLFLAAWILFILNWAFFEFPWPWVEMAEWTKRTPNGICFTVCVVGLTLMIVVGLLFEPRRSDSTDSAAL